MDIAVVSLLIIIAISCALVGVYVVSFKISMLIEGLAHTILLGVVLIYLIFKKVNIGYMIAGSLFSGIFLILLVEILSRSKFISKDIAIGIIMPLLFSIAIVITSGPLRNSRISKEMILTGNLILATYSELIGGVFPVSILVNIFVLIVNTICIAMFYKELKIATFDKGFAKSINMHPRKIYYLLLLNATLTVGCSLDAFGIVMIVGMLVIPASTAILISKNQKQFITLTLIFAVLISLVGYLLASLLDLSHSGSVTTTGLVVLLLVVLFRKGDGAIYSLIHRMQLKKELELVILLNRLNKNKGNSINELPEKLGWDEKKANKILKTAFDNNYVENVRDIQLTQGGHTILKKYFN